MQVPRIGGETGDLRIYIPKALEFRRLAKLAYSASRQIDDGVVMNDAHVFALLEYFEFLAPDQFKNVVGPGLAAEFSTVTEHEFPLEILKQKSQLLTLLLDHTSMFAAAFCRHSEEEPHCYREWKRFRKENSQGEEPDAFACLSANFAHAMTLGQSPSITRSKIHLLKHCILRRTAEVLRELGYHPEDHLREIRPEQGPSPAQLLALQVFVLSKGGPDDAIRHAGKITTSEEATFLCWASRDAFVQHVLEQWQWLKPALYDDSPDAHPPKRCDGLLHANWKNGSGGPSGLAKRELPRRAGIDECFPCVLGDSEVQRFAPVSIMMIGRHGVGKASFLRTLTQRLNQGEAMLSEELSLAPAEAPEFSEAAPGQDAPPGSCSGAQPSGYDMLVCNRREPQVARWMRVSLTNPQKDLEEESVPGSGTSPEFLKALRSAKGLMFFVDERYFADLLTGNSFSANRRKTTRAPARDAAELGAWFTRVLQAYFDVNRDAMHLPIALIVNKADLLLGSEHLQGLDQPFLIANETKMELVHSGVQNPAEPQDVFGRLRYCIRHAPGNSKDLNNQALIFELLERFRGFITAALDHTFRFQIFLTSSAPSAEGGRELQFGVWEATKWLVNQLEPAYRTQIEDQLRQDRLQLEQLKNDIEKAMLSDTEAYLDFENACRKKQSRVASKVHLGILDSVLGRDPTTTGKRIDSARERMRTALQEAFSLAQLHRSAFSADPVPFTARRRMVQEALHRLDRQIEYLQQWQDQLRHKDAVPFLRSEMGKKTPARQLADVAQERFAS